MNLERLCHEAAGMRTAPPSTGPPGDTPVWSPEELWRWEQLHAGPKPHAG